MWTDGREARRVGQRYGDRQREKGGGGAQRGLWGGCCVGWIASLGGLFPISSSAALPCGGVAKFGCCICACSIDCCNVSTLKINAIEPGKFLT